jgi:uncharacterized protein
MTSILLPISMAASSPTTSSSLTATLNIPRLGRLMDPAHVIDDYSAKIILKEIQSVEQDTGTEFQVLVVNHIDAKYYPKTFATKPFNKWQIGSSEKNNAILILIVLSQRRIEIQVGRSLDVFVNAAWATDLLEREAVPAFKVQQYGHGVYNTVAAVSNCLREVDSGIVVRPRKKNDWSFDDITVGTIVSVAAAGVSVSTFLDRKYLLGDCVCK